MKSTFYQRYGKRLFDLLIVVPGLLAISPLLFGLAILVRITLGSPVFFKQPRPGSNEKIFTALKFRTMTDERDTDGKLLPDAKRLTKLGAFMRRTSLDELPQLFNVLIGNMSLVGPRPLLTEYLDYYTERERYRHTVMPGITGLAQISGRNNVPWNERLELDVRYVENQSFMLDIYILLKTFIKVFKRTDIQVDTAKEGSLKVYREKYTAENTGSGENK